MNSVAKRAIAAAAVALCILPLAGAQFAVNADRSINVSGNAEVRVVPDEVVLTLGVETNDMVLATAKQDNDRRVRKVIAAAQAAGVEARHTQTDFLDIEPRYHFVDSAKPRVFDGYWVRKTVVLTLKSVSKFDDLLTNTLDGGANYVLGIEFRTTELRKHRDAARAMAIRAAREKAEALARELGVGVGAVRSINEGGQWWYPSYSNYRGDWGQRTSGRGMMQNAMQPAGANPQETEGTLAPGQILVTAQVQVVFELK